MWLTDPELFLYSKVGGDDVQVWRCKKTMTSSSSPSSLVVPMVPHDFEYVSQVEDHSDLVDGNILDWEETDYKALVKYISERRLLVNGQGLVIAELSKFSEEDGDDQTDADVLPIYLRSLDILSLKAYIPKLRERPIPSRKVQYLEDVNGKAAPVEGGDSSTTTTITTKLKQDLADAETENKALEAKNAKLKQDVAAREDKVVDLESKKKTVEEKVTKLSADLVVWKTKFTDLDSKSSKTSRDEEERITKFNAEIVVLKNKVKDLESKNKTQEQRITKLNADLASKTTQLAVSQRANNRESWMNDITPKSEWVSFNGLERITWALYVKIVEGMGTEYTVDDGKSNVRATYWSTVQLNENRKLFKAIAVQKHLGPNWEKAKFDTGYCWSVRSNFGVLYAVTNT